MEEDRDAAAAAFGPGDLTTQSRVAMRDEILMDDPTMQAIREAIAAYARGEILVVVDDEHRENEGDLVVAAEYATPAAIQFMIREG